MSDERYILAQLKRRLLTEKSKRDSDLFYSYEVLAIIAELEADAVLGEDVEQNLPWAEQEVE